MSKRVKTNFHNQPWMAGYTDKLEWPPEVVTIASGFQTQAEVAAALEAFKAETGSDTLECLNCFVQQDMDAPPLAD